MGRTLTVIAMAGLIAGETKWAGVAKPTIDTCLATQSPDGGWCVKVSRRGASF